MSDYTITTNAPGWEHMRFKIATRAEFEAANPCHRFHQGDGELLVAESCSLCPHNETREQVLDRLEILGRELLAKHHGNRAGVAIELGYLPAWIAWKAKATHGAPLVFIADFARKQGLKMDWGGIEYEAAKEGVDIHAEIEEAKRELRILG
jgi:hypothetical protein